MFSAVIETIKEMFSERPTHAQVEALIAERLREHDEKLAKATRSGLR